MSGRKPSKEYEDKKKLINFYIGKKELEKINIIMARDDTIFEDRSQIIRYLIKLGIIQFQKDLDKETQGSEKD